jgi:spore coat polysaccharide biosynthesis protein SpsF (cytidylyltransferase family)
MQNSWNQIATEVARKIHFDFDYSSIRDIRFGKHGELWSAENIMVLNAEKRSIKRAQIKITTTISAINDEFLVMFFVEPEHLMSQMKLKHTLTKRTTNISEISNLVASNFKVITQAIKSGKFRE